MSDSALSLHAVGAERLKGHLAMLAFAALIAGSFSFGSVATRLADPAALNAVRFLCGSVIMFAATVVLNKGRVPAPVTPWRYFVLGGFMAVYFTTMFIALSFTSPVSTSAVFTLTPLMSAVFGFFILGQAPRPIVIASLVAASLGALVVIFRGDFSAMLRFEVGPGEAIYFIGCVGHAFYAPMIRKLNRGEQTLAYSTYTTGALAVILMVYGLPAALSTDWLHQPAIVWVAIAYLAAGTTAVTFFLMQYGSLRLPAAKVMAYGYLVPGFVIVYEGMAGHGWPTLVVVGGAAVTGTGLLVLYLSADT